MGEVLAYRTVAASRGSCRLVRLGSGLAALGLVLVLGMAGRLRPDPRGYGTHRQLGLPPCAFRTWTGRACPSCGMTTAFSWTVRGRLDQAWRANPAGCLLALGAIALVPWFLIAAWRGRPMFGVGSVAGPAFFVIFIAVAVGLAFWSVRMTLGRV